MTTYLFTRYLADKFVDEQGWTSEDIAKDAQEIKRRPQCRNN